MPYHIIASSDTDYIHTLIFDESKPGAASLSLSSGLPVGAHTSWVEKHPSDPSLVFAALEGSEDRLLVIRYEAQTGAGEVIASIPSGGQTPCSIVVVEDEVLVANYNGGSVSFFKLGKTDMGEVTLTESQPPLIFSGSGPCKLKNRQLSPHAHQVYAVKNGKGDGVDVLVPDLGTDRIYKLSKECNGEWAVSEVLFFDEHPGGGPRHVVVEDGRLYTLLELTNQVVVHDMSEGEPKLITDVQLSVPSGIAPLEMIGAELLFPHPNKSFPDRLLYASNRDDPRDHGDQISIYDIVPQGLELVGTVGTGLKHVKNFCFFGPEDRYCVVGGVFGGGIKVFERTEGGKNMKELAHLPAAYGGAGLAPTSFVVL